MLKTNLFHKFFPSQTAFPTTVTDFTYYLAVLQTYFAQKFFSVLVFITLAFFILMSC